MATNLSCIIDVPLSEVDWSFHHKFPLPTSLGLYGLIGAFTALALWSSVPLTTRLLFVFKRYRGLYFWSILIVTWSLHIRAIGFLLRYTVPSCPLVLTGVISEIGWVGMVSGFSVVLYSRLGLLLYDRILRPILALIVVDGVCLHTSTIAVQFGYASQPNNDPRKREPWIAASDVIEPLQGVVFTVQQLIISAVYIKAAWDHLRSSTATQAHVRKLMQSLIAVQVLVLVLDVVVVVLECAGYFVVKMIIHSFIYSVKLELEFVVLNQLVAVSRAGEGQINIPSGHSGNTPAPVPRVDPELGTTGLHRRNVDPAPTVEPGSPRQERGKTQEVLNHF